MSSELAALWELPAARAAAILLGTLVVAKVLEKTLLRAIVALTLKSRSNLDDLIVNALRRPVFLSVC